MHTPERLSKKSVSALRSSDHVLELSVISIVEIAIKTSLGKLDFSEENVLQAVHDLDLRILAFTAEHAFRMFALPRHHDDPFDRQIIAQSLSEEIPIITPDQKFVMYKNVRVIW